MAWSKDEFLKENPHLKDFLPFLDTHNEESPRGAILVACSFLEEQLGAIIDAFLLEGSEKSLWLEGFNAPIGTFSARIKAAHCLGLISQSERDDCDTLRKIRNEFAHNHRSSFDDQKVIDLCKNLHHAAKSYGAVTVSPYGQFSTGSVGLIMNLVNRAHYVSEQRLKRRDWPR